MVQRFYQIDLQNRPAYWEDIGTNLTIEGLVITNGKNNFVLLTPSSNAVDLKTAPLMKMTVEEWSDFIRASDDPKIFELDKTGGIKAVHRKIRYQISGEVQQQIWVRDGLKCQFCDKKIGEATLTVDHFFPLERGGKNNQSNYLTMCRPCNKRKANLDPKVFCENNGLDFDYFVAYLGQFK